MFNWIRNLLTLVFLCQNVRRVALTKVTTCWSKHWIAYYYSISYVIRTLEYFFVSLFINVITSLKNYQLALIYSLKARAAFANGPLCSLFSLQMLISLFLPKLKKPFKNVIFRLILSIWKICANFSFNLHFSFLWHNGKEFICIYVL